ncbi:chemotaxis protein CheW [Desulfoluna limicola]|uniref:Chemotaxis protein CheW n=1 Tax=Desulfoluna limicola TaxID=2810562 RepID=A0ABM7PBH6_9BACT|nr:chemotaxis protein CheW [Desulfoluna limicola]BCS95005.1 chemotaxis protein CheW [Desulfoluna limicola]
MNRENNAEDNRLELATFRLGEALCGINLLTIQEINKQTTITKVPLAETYVHGVLNLRGRIVTVIDLGRKIGLAPTERTQETRNIIIDSEGEQLGLLVDGMEDLLTTDPAAMEPAPANLGGIHGDYIKGVFTTRKALIGFLNIEAVLADF